MVGIGGMVGLFIALSFRFYVDVVWLLAIFLVLSGVVAWARLALNAHRPSQVYAGFLIGSIIIALTIILF